MTRPTPIRLSNRRKPKARSTTCRPLSRNPRLAIESLESRQMLTGGFLEGTAFVDGNANNQLDAGETYLAGAKIDLYQGSSTTPIATQTTLSDGKYLFDNLDPGTYRLVETPPLDYFNQGTQILSQIQASPVQVSSSTIEVTIVDPNSVFVNYNGITSANGARVNVTLFGTPVNGGNTIIAGLMDATIGTAIGSSDLSGPFKTFCVDLLDPVSNGDKFQVVPTPSDDFALQNPGRIAYLYNHYHAASLTKAEAVGLQVAIWELVYDTTLDLSDGNFILTNVVTTTGADTASVLAAANTFLGDSAGKDEVATVLAVHPSVPAGDSQAMLATGSFNFANSPGVVLGDFVWQDTNFNGIQENGEPGIQGVTLTITGIDDLGAITPRTVTTGSLGEYQVGNLRPGTYSVEVDASNFVGAGALVGFIAAPTLVGADRAIDSNDTPSGSDPTTLAAGESDFTIDFGFYQPGKISGAKYRDVSGNGLNLTAGPSSPADTPLANVTIYLDLDNDGTLDNNEPTAITAADGTYEFTGLLPGTYYIREIVTANFLRTAPVLSDKYTVAVASGTNSTENDFANFEIVCSDCTVSGVSYKIIHADGTSEVVNNLRGQTMEGDLITVTFDIDEPGSHTISFVSYTAPDPYFDANRASQQAIYDVASGVFSEGGPYTLTISVPNSYYQVDFVCGEVISQLGPAGSNIFYTPQRRLISADNSGTHAPISNPGTVSGVKYNDLDGDGTRDGGEPGLKGWVIYIDQNGNGAKDASEPATVTRPDGTYTITNLPAGAYTGKVKEVMQSGWVQSAGPGALVLAAGENKTGVNFGNRHAATGVISGYKFNDRNADGEWDKNGLDNRWGTSDDEVGLSGWKIFVDLDHDGQFDANEPYDITDSNGHYEITGLIFGSYELGEVMQSGWIRTTEEAVVSLSSSCQSATNVNFGNFKGNLIGVGDTATVGFWKGTNGQNLIKKLNGGGSYGTSKALGYWLADNFGNMYGSGCGTNNLAGKTNAQIATYFKSLANNSYKQLEAQVLATVLAVYVTDIDWAGGSYAASYGFNVSSNGIKNDYYNIGDNGAAFGVANDSALTVWDILQRTNARADDGVLWENYSSSIKLMAKLVYTGINDAGGSHGG